MKKHINNGSVNECSTERGECEGVSFVQLERLLCTYVGVGEKEEKGAGCAWSLGGIALKLSSWYVSLRSIVVGENTYSGRFVKKSARNDIMFRYISRM